MSTLAPPPASAEPARNASSTFPEQSLRQKPEQNRPEILSAGAQVLGSLQAPATRLSATAWWLLALTAACSLLWSYAKPLSQDEIFVLQTDSVRSLQELIHVQCYTPISLDPLAYHLAGFLSLHLLGARAVGARAFALRLPSLLGFLTMQACLYRFVRRSGPPQHRFQPSFGTERAALLALFLPALSVSLFYSAEARPYGLLLGSCGLVLVSWQAAVQAEAHRQRALAVLLFSLGLALNTHYFAVLLLLPLAAAETHRLMLRRRIDWPLLGALVVGTGAALLTLPFQRAAGEFRAHYYNANAVSPHAISQAYRALVADYTVLSFVAQQRIAAVFLLLGLLFGARLANLLWWNRLRLARPEATLLLSFAALPFAGFLLACFVTHSFEVRYVLCALVGLSGLLALTLESILGKRVTWRFLLPACVALLSATTAWHLHAERTRAREDSEKLALSSRFKETLATLPDQHLYVQNLGQFESALLYAPEARLRERLVLLYSREQELRWDRHDTASLTAMHLRQFCAVPTLSWLELTSRPGPHLLVLYHSGWDWTDDALKSSGAELTPLGPALGGDAVLVRWKAALPGFVSAR